MSIQNLDPQIVWKNFYDLTQIPRPSKHEELAVEYMYNWGKAHGLETIKDEIGNIVIRKPATPGFENRKGVILQGHIDMVPQKNNDTVHDFEKDPIQTWIDGEWVKAKGTSTTTTIIKVGGQAVETQRVYSLESVPASSALSQYVMVDSDGQRTAKKVRLSEVLATATTHNKGYYATLADLIATFPTAPVGSIAYVGEKYPFTLYRYENDQWINTGQTGGDEQIDLSGLVSKEELQLAIKESAVVETNTSKRGDFEIADERGRVLVRFADGHIETRNFNSRDGATKEDVQSAIKESAVSKEELNTAIEESGSELREELQGDIQTAIDEFAVVKTNDAKRGDFEIADENGKILVRFIDGHIVTKNFDSRDSAAPKIGVIFE